MRDVIAVMNDHVAALMAVPGVVGVAVGALDDGSPCILVLVVEKTPQHDALIPGVIEGYGVVVQESGEIRALRP